MKSLAKIAIRMMALFYIVKGISGLPSFLYYMGRIGDSEGFNTPMEYASVLLPIGICILTGIILWFVAGAITNKMIDKEEELATFPLPVVQALQVALIIIGVVMVVNSVPVLVSNIYLHGKYDGFQTIFSVNSELIEQSVKIVIGIVIAIFAPFITKNIFKLIQVEKTNEK